MVGSILAARPGTTMPFLVSKETAPVNAASPIPRLRENAPNPDVMCAGARQLPGSHPAPTHADLSTPQGSGGMATSTVTAALVPLADGVYAFAVNACIPLSPSTNVTSMAAGDAFLVPRSVVPS